MPESDSRKRPAAEGESKIKTGSHKRARASKGATAGAATAAAPAARPPEAGGAKKSTARLRFPIPPLLRKQLVDDWEYVTKDKMLITLPRKRTVSAVLDEFCRSKAKGGVVHPSWTGVAAGVRGYFNEAVRPVLLYRPEMEQLEALQRNGKLPADLADLYGPEHLLRLFVKLPGLLAKADLDEESAKFLETKVGSLVKFLAKKADELFEAAVYTTTAAAAATD
jgi:mortality factor 4-like protein 1